MSFQSSSSLSTVPPQAIVNMPNGLRPALFFLGALAAGVITVLAVTRRQDVQQRRLESRSTTRRASAFIVSLGILCTIYGGLLLIPHPKHRVEQVVEALISLALGVPVVHLPQLISELSSSHTGERLLVVLLSTVTCVALLEPFLPQIPPVVSPVIFLIYTIAAGLRLSFVLYRFYKPTNIRLPTTAKPITIHVDQGAGSGPHHPEVDPHIPKHLKGWSVDSSASSITAIDHIHRTPLLPPEALVLAPPTPGDIEYQPITSSVPFDTHTFHLRAQVTHYRTRNLLALLFAAQFCNLCAYALSIGSVSGSIHSLAPSSSPSRRAHNIQIPQVIQTACTVLSVIGTMSAYLLHTYNTHLGSVKVPSLFCLPSPFSKSKRGPKAPVTLQTAPSGTPAAPTSPPPSVHNLGEGVPMATQMAPPSASSLNPSAFPTRTVSGRRRSQHRRNTNQLYGPRASVQPPTPTRPAPIILTYQAPVSKSMSERSLLETTDEERCQRTIAGAETNIQAHERKGLSNAHSYTSMRSEGASTNESEVTKVECVADRSGEVVREEEMYGYKKSNRISTVGTTVTALTTTTNATIGTAITTSTTRPLSTITSGAVTTTTTGTRRQSTSNRGAKISKSDRRKKFEDPALYIKKRGAIPQPQRKGFGKLSWSSIGLHCLAARSKDAEESFPTYTPPISPAAKNSGGDVEYFKKGHAARPSLENVDTSWIDIDARGDGGLGSGGLLSALGLGDDKEKSKEFKGSKRNTAPAAPNLASRMLENPDLMGFGKEWNGILFPGTAPLSTLAQRQMKRRVGIVPTASAPSSRPGTAESGEGSNGAFEASNKFIRVDVETTVVEEVEVVPLPKKVAALLGEEKRVIKKPYATSAMGLQARRSLKEGRALGPNLILGNAERQALDYVVQDDGHPRHPFSGEVEDEGQIIEIEASLGGNNEDLRKANFEELAQGAHDVSRPGSPTPTPTPIATPRKTKFPTFLSSPETLLPSQTPTPEKKANISRRIMDPPHSPPTSFKLPNFPPKPTVSSPERDSLLRRTSTHASVPAESLPPPPPRRVRTTSKRQLPARPPSPEPLVRTPTRKSQRSLPSPPTTYNNPSPNISTSPFGNVKSALGLASSSSGSGRTRQGVAAYGQGATYAFGGEVVVKEDESEGDPTNLKDPFASAALPLKVRRSGSVETSYEFTLADGTFSSRQSSEDPNGRSSVEDVLIPRGAKALRGATRMSAWGRLPMQEMAYAKPEGTRLPANTNSKSYSGSISAGSGKSRKHKEKRTRRTSRVPARRTSRTLDDDAVEEALLAQRLLRRLDDEGWDDVRL